MTARLVVNRRKPEQGFFIDARLVGEGCPIGRVSAARLVGDIRPLGSILTK